MEYPENYDLKFDQQKNILIFEDQDSGVTFEWKVWEYGLLDGSNTVIQEPEFYDLHVIVGNHRIWTLDGRYLKWIRDFVKDKLVDELYDVVK